jgi:hypothetical protein
MGGRNRSRPIEFSHPSTDDARTSFYGHFVEEVVHFLCWIWLPVAPAQRWLQGQSAGSGLVNEPQVPTQRCSGDVALTSLHFDPVTVLGWHVASVHPPVPTLRLHRLIGLSLHLGSFFVPTLLQLPVTGPVKSSTAATQHCGVSEGQTNAGTATKNAPKTKHTTDHCLDISSSFRKDVEA